MRWLGLAALVLAAVASGRCVMTHTHRPRMLDLAHADEGVPIAKAKTMFVFLHGYGGSNDDVAWIIDDLKKRTAGKDIAFVLVEGPFASGGGRTWGDSSVEQAESIERVRALVKKLARAQRPEQIVISGFSQGAMIAHRVALPGDVAKTAVLLGGCGYAFDPGAADKKVRYTFLHGSADSLCPFAAADEIASAMSDRGLDAEMIPFNGDHEVPEVARLEIARLLGEPR